MATGLSSIGDSVGELEAACVKRRSTAGHVGFPVTGFVAIGYLGGEQGPARIIGIFVVNCTEYTSDRII